MKFEAVPLEQMPQGATRTSKYDAILDAVKKGEGVQIPLDGEKTRSIWHGIKHRAKARGLKIKTYQTDGKLCVVPAPK